MTTRKKFEELLLAPPSAEAPRGVSSPLGQCAFLLARSPEKGEGGRRRNRKRCWWRATSVVQGQRLCDAHRDAPPPPVPRINKRFDLCQARRCQRANSEPKGFCLFHNPEHIAASTARLLEGRKKWKASGKPRKPRRPVFEIVGICLWRSPRVMMRFPNLTLAEKHEIIAPCGRPANAGEGICSFHVARRVTEEIAAKLDAEFVPASPPMGPEDLAALARMMPGGAKKVAGKIASPLGTCMFVIDPDKSKHPRDLERCPQGVTGFVRGRRVCTPHRLELELMYASMKGRKLPEPAKGDPVP
jgi:hypothetical protein